MMRAWAICGMTLLLAGCMDAGPLPVSGPGLGPGPGMGGFDLGAAVAGQNGNGPTDPGAPLPMGGMDAGMPVKLGSISSVMGESARNWAIYGSADGSGTPAARVSGADLTIEGTPADQQGISGGQIRISGHLSGPLAAGVPVTGVQISVSAAADGSTPALAAASGTAHVSIDRAAAPSGGNGFGTLTGSFSARLCSGGGGSGCQTISGSFATSVQVN
ncbi:MAG: hypothetical protein GC146_14200 [Limimaricola sp.]|uniref:hypothetical protein n=1 Tax=Limimaricola sp. TaxID=2211665 RepID=UPI001DC872EC|nr:hypothetical protein [Limimaricola sp.]MBI1418369.1 hypothetical protein [Limimaricola sp.]